MSKLENLNGDKLRFLEVKTNVQQISFVNTVYDEGESLWKVENGILFVYEISMTRHPEEGFQPLWKPVVQTEHADEVIVYDWPFKNELERQKVNT